MNRQQILREIEQKAPSYERKYVSCSQSTLLTLQEVLNLQDNTVLKASYGLAGGGGGTGEGFCGALSAGIIAIGIKYGRSREELEDTEWGRAVELTKVLVDRFVKEYGGPRCKDVQKFLFGKIYNFWDPVEQEMVKAGAIIDKCVNVVKNGALWAAEIIIDEDEKKRGEIS